MLSWEEIVQNYITKYSDRIRKTTQPLRDHFNVGYFSYHRIDNEGNYSVLVDRPDWAEQYVSRQIFLNDPYLRHPSVYRSGISLIDSHGTPEYREQVMKAGKEVLDMDMAAMLIQKDENGVEFFGFTGNKERSSLQSLYLNHPQLLKSFAVHFKSELKDIMREMQQESCSLFQLKGKDFHCSDLICPDINLDAYLSYLKDIGWNKEVEKAQMLTPRERQCLKLLIEGKSAKETGLLLALSPRTVESYFENMKNKLCCWSKQDLLKIAKILDEIGYLNT